MAARFWVGSDTSWNTAGNWASTSGGAGGAGVPTSADDVTFDGNDTGNCTCDVAIDCASLDVQAGYTGTLDLADSAYAHVCSGNMTFSGGGTVDCGDATITCSGDFNYLNQTTWTKGTSTVVLDGTAKTLTAANNQMYNLTISGTITLSSSTDARVHASNAMVISSGATFTLDEQARSGTTMTIDGAVVINASGELNNGANGDCTFASTANVSGAGIYTNTGASGGTTTVVSGASLTCAGFTLTRNATLSTATSYDISAVPVTFQQQAVSRTAVIDGDFTFGDLTIDADDAGAGDTYTLDLATHNPSLTITGDLTMTGAGLAQFTWTKGTGTITLSGSADQTIDFDGETIEDLVVNKSAGNLVLSDGFTTDSFTGTSTGTGDFDPAGQSITTTGDCDWAAAFLFDSAADCLNGSTWTVGGNWTADGQTLNANAAWTLAVTGTAVASGTGDVAYCDASGGTAIDATAGPWTDSGNNSNWSFAGGLDPLTAQVGTLTLTGQTATIAATRKLSASAGALTITGQTATIAVTRKLSASAGTLTLTAQTATIAAGNSLNAQAGTLTLTGQTATLSITRKLTASAGTLTLAGQTATLTTGTPSLTAQAGALTLTGLDATITATRKLSASAGTLTLAGLDATLAVNEGNLLEAQAGTLTLTGYPATLTYSAAAASTPDYAVVAPAITRRFVSSNRGRN